MKAAISIGAPALVLAILCAPVKGQDKTVNHDVFFYTPAMGAQAAPGSGAGMKTFEFISADAGIPGKVVKGAPFSATAVTETVQTLADGNRITHESTSSLARDSEGRMRREQSLPAIGPYASEGATPKFVTISDPTAGTTYVLDDRAKTVRKMLNRAPMGLPGGPGPVTVEHNVRVAGGGAGAASAGGNVMVYQRVIDAGAASEPHPKTEQLGQRNIEGVVADGTRTTMTLPAGSVGNERAIDVVDERWYSSELQTTIMSKHTDPRMGETTFRLTKVSRAEPAKSLFEVPPEYKLAEVPGQPVEIRLGKPGDREASPRER